MAGKSNAEKAAEALLAKAIELSGLSAEGFAALADDEKNGFTVKAQEAIDAEAAKPKTTNTAKPKKPEADANLVAVSKDGEQLEVHPSTLAAHKSAGWVEV